MMNRMSMLVTATLALTLSGCTGLPMLVGGGGSALMCEDLGASADAQKIEAFVSTGARFEREVNALSADVEATCAAMAADLGIQTPRATDGSLQVEATCHALAHEIRAIVEASVPRDATFEVRYAAPECTVELTAMASCVARCDASMSASSEVSCTEDAVGRSCWGDSNARADAQCEAACEAELDLRAECSAPEVEVYASATVDPAAQARFEALVATLEVNYPRFAALEARLDAIAQSGAELVTTFGDAMDATGRLGMTAMVCFGQTTAATADAMATVQVTVSVTVDVSASVSAS